MIKILLFLTILFLNDTKSDLEIKCEEIIKSYFGNSITIEKIKFTIPRDIRNKIEKENKQRFFADFVYVWKVYQSGINTATAILDNVYGKSLPITFLVICNYKGEIIGSEIVKYREPYGGAIQEKSWLKQFIGKNNNSSFEVGRDINTISGATISVNSVSTGIKKVVMLFSFIKDGL